MENCMGIANKSNGKNLFQYENRKYNNEVTTNAIN
jgi:hypothetical protein